MNKKDYQKLLQTGLDNDGIQFCLNALQEECAELVVAISHFRRGRANEDYVVREMADVKLMIDMVKLGLSDDISFDHYIERKAKNIGMYIRWKNEQKNTKKSFKT